MTAKWQAGHTYVPGDLVTPSSSSITTPTLTNADFESGDTGWDKTGTWSIDATGTPYHGSWDATAIASGEIINQQSNDIAAGIEVTASCAVKSHGTTGTNMQVMIVWFDGSGVRLTGQEALGNGNTLHDTQQISTVTAKAPTNAKSFRIGAKATIIGTGGYDTNYSVCDFFAVSCAQAVPKGLVFKATQANPGKSGSSEPTWPATTGVSVTDNEVTWEGVIATRVVWEAQPLLKSGSTEPTWPDADDGAVHDNIIDWQAVTPRITDSLCPQSKIVTIAANKVFVGDGDVVRYCATNDATDWNSEQDAGYLPTGLQAVGETQCTALGVYRGNVVAWTASSMEVWQVDPDPARMAIVDTVEGVGTTFVRAAIGMMNDLFFLSPLGVRSVSTSATTGTMGAADVGSPVDPLVRAAINTAVAAGIDPVGVFYSNASQFWIFLGAEAYVYAISQATGIKAWSRYTFPWSVTHACVKDGELYVRTSANDVYVLDESIRVDYTSATTAQIYDVTVQWPWLDLSAPGSEKMLIGADVVFEQSVAGTALSVSGDLLDANQGNVDSYQYTLSGSITPLSASIASGALPAGLSLSASGLVSGTRTTAGNYAWTVRVTDAIGNTFDLPDSCTTISTDIVNYSTVDDGLNQSPSCVHVANGIIFIGCANSSAAVSTDQGATWSTNDVSGIFASALIDTAIRFNGDWYAFGGGTAARAIGDSMSFASMANPPANVATGSGSNLRGKLYVGDGAVTTGNSAIYRMESPGAAWTRISMGVASKVVRCMLDTGTAYLFGTSNGDLIRSTDLTTFSVVKSVAGVTFISMAKLGSTIIAAASNGNWYKSTDDGATWSAAQTTPAMQYVCATPSMFVGGYTDHVYTSPDGVTWTDRGVTLAGNPLQGGASTDGTTAALPRQSQWVTVGTT